MSQKRSGSKRRGHHTALSGRFIGPQESFRDTKVPSTVVAHQPCLHQPLFLLVACSSKHVARVVLLSALISGLCPLSSYHSCHCFCCATRLPPFDSWFPTFLALPIPRLCFSGIPIYLLCRRRLPFIARVFYDLNIFVARDSAVKAPGFLVRVPVMPILSFFHPFGVVQFLPDLSIMD